MKQTPRMAGFLVALLLLVLLLTGCDENCSTTITCEHIFNGKEYTRTVPGKQCHCKMFYAATQCDPYCIDE